MESELCIPVSYLQTIGIIDGILSFAFLILTGIPVARILKRTGFNPWRALLILVPVVNLIGLWVFAFGRWPVESDQQTLGLLHLN